MACINKQIYGHTMHTIEWEKVTLSKPEMTDGRTYVTTAIKIIRDDNIIISVFFLIWNTFRKMTSHFIGRPIFGMLLL